MVSAHAERSVLRGKKSDGGGGGEQINDCHGCSFSFQFLIFDFGFFFNIKQGLVRYCFCGYAARTQ